jgi:hypothetical protein
MCTSKVEGAKEQAGRGSYRRLLQQPPSRFGHSLSSMVASRCKNTLEKAPAKPMKKEATRKLSKCEVNTAWQDREEDGGRGGGEEWMRVVHSIASPSLRWSTFRVFPLLFAHGGDTYREQKFERERGYEDHKSLIAGVWVLWVTCG